MAVHGQEELPLLAFACPVDGADVRVIQRTGVTIGADGSVYLSIKGTLSGAGEVLRIDY